MNESIIFEIVSKKDEFKKRGAAVVGEGLAESWENLIDASLKDPNQIWYNGVCIEGALESMEKLNQGLPVEAAYKPIDISDSNEPKIIMGMQLSPWQNGAITSVIASYHERGQEFEDYRNSLVCTETNNKTR